MPSSSNWVQLNGTSVDVGTTLTITATQTSQSTANNTSVITLTYTIASGKNWGDFYTPTNTYMTPTIDGVAGTRTKVTNPATLHKGESAVVLTTTHTVTHDSDGKKTVSISVFYDDRPGGGATTKTVSTFYLTLDTIARKSTMTATNATLGGSVTFSITSKSSAFTHKIYASCGNWNNNNQPISTGGAWTVPDLSGYFSSSETSKTVTFTLHTYSGGTDIGSNTASCTISLPGKNTSSAQSVQLGSSKNIPITKAYSSYKSTVEYTLNGGSSWTRIGDAQTTGTSVSFSPAASLGSNFPTEMSHTYTFRVTTYANSTGGYRSIGSNTYNLTLTIPDYQPSVSFTTARIKNDNSTIAGWGIAVKGYTKYEYAATSTNYYGATTASWSFSCGGRTKSGSSGTTDAFTSTGSSTPTIVVTDSRGKQNNAKATAITIYDYGAPVIVSSYAYRSDANGNRKEDGTYVTAKINAKTDYTCGGKNSITVQSRWKTSTGSWSSWTNRTNNTEFKSSDFAIDKSYQFELRVVDSLGSPKSVTYPIPTAFVTEVAKAGGKAVGFFGYPQEEGLTVYGDGHIKSSDAESVAEWTKQAFHFNVPVSMDGDGFRTSIGSTELTRRIYSEGYANNSGWMRVAKTTLNSSNQVDPFIMYLHLTRIYFNEPSESYEIVITQGWSDSCTITQLSGSASTNLIKQCVLRLDVTNHMAYVEIYVSGGRNNYYNCVIDVMNDRYTRWESDWRQSDGSGTTLGRGYMAEGTSVKSLYVGGHSSPIGKIELSAAGSVSKANQSWGTGAELTLTTGTWVIVGRASFPSNSTGWRIIEVNTGNYVVEDNVVSSPACNGTATRLSKTLISAVEGSATFRVYVIHSAGTTLNNITTTLRAIRIS